MALKKVPNPTFVHPVRIPVPGEPPEKVNFTFKYKNKPDLEKFLSDTASGKMTDPDAVLEIADGWELDEVFGKFGKKALEELFTAYIGAPRAIIDSYIEGMIRGRQGN